MPAAAAAASRGRLGRPWWKIAPRREGREGGVRGREGLQPAAPFVPTPQPPAAMRLEMDGGAVGRIRCRLRGGVGAWELERPCRGLLATPDAGGSSGLANA